VTSPVNIDNAPYRYELWKLDTNTLIHVRLTGRFLEIGDPALTEPGAFQGYPIGYEWRLYRQLGRWDASEIATLTS
jgi:hypothetical protein